MPYWEDPDDEKSDAEKCIEAPDEIDTADELDDETNNPVIDVIKVCFEDIFTLFDIKCRIRRHHYFREDCISLQKWKDLMQRPSRKFTLARVRRDPQMERTNRQFTLARVRREPQMTRTARVLSLARVRRDPPMPRQLRQLSLARVRRDPDIQRTTRQLSLARVRRGRGIQRMTRKLSLARVRRDPITQRLGRRQIPETKLYKRMLSLARI